MRKLQTWIFVALMLPALALPAFARKPDREVQVTWAKLEKLVKGKDAVVVTTSGESIEGKIRRVSADALELDELFEKKRHRLIPRADVRAVKLEELHRHWRLGGTLIGLFGTAAIFGATSGKSNGGEGTTAGYIVPWGMAGIR